MAAYREAQRNINRLLVEMYRGENEERAELNGGGKYGIAYIPATDDLSFMERFRRFLKRG